MIARELAERVRQRRLAARVVERVTGFVQEGLVVVEAALGARDQVDDVRRVGSDHACARRLLRAVVQIEPDPGSALDVEPERAERGDADLDRALLRVRLLERGEPAQIARVIRGRHILSLGPEQLVEPALAQRRVHAGGCPRRGVEDALELVQRDPLLFCVPGDRVGLARELGLERLAGGEQLAAVVVEAGALRVRERAELVAVAVDREHCQLRLGGPQRQLLPAPADPRGQEPVLELVLSRRELGGEDARLARLAEPIEQLALVRAAGLLRFAQQLELGDREEIAVPLDDHRLLGRLLLADADGTSLLGALEEVAREPLLVLGRSADGRNAHAPGRLPLPPGGAGLRES